MTTSRNNTIMSWMAYTDFLSRLRIAAGILLPLNTRTLLLYPGGRDCIGAAGVDAYVLLEHTRPKLKTAKFAVLPPGHAGLPKCVKQSDGSNSAPVRNGPCFAVCALVCDFSRRAECVPTFARESKRRPFVREVENRDERWPEIELLLMVRVLREPGNVCI